MRVFKLALDFYINSSIHVALAIYALSWLTLLQFGLDYDENVLCFIFFSSITGYNFVKYFGLAKFHHRSLASWLKMIQIFSLICFIILCYFAFKLELKTLIYVGGFGLATFLYAIPLIPKKIFLDHQKNLRSISGLKIYVIALVWSGVTVFLPLVNANYEFTNDVIIVAIKRFLFVLVLMLPFEIRDLKYDSLKLATIPQKIGVTYTKIVGVVLLVVFFFLEFLKANLDQQQLTALLLITVITLIFLVFTRKRQTMYYSSLWVESLPVIWLILLLLLG